MHKYIKLTGLIIGFSSVLCNTIILIKNYPMVIGLQRFILEGNQLIRTLEIGLGIIGIIILISLISQEINRK